MIGSSVWLERENKGWGILGRKGDWHVLTEGSSRVCADSRCSVRGQASEKEKRRHRTDKQTLSRASCGQTKG